MPPLRGLPKATGYAGGFLLAFMTGCVSTTIDWHKMNLDSNTNNIRSQLLNPRNATVDSELFQQAEKLMSRGFFDTRSEEFGYYTIDLRYTHSSPSSAFAWAFLAGLTLYIPAIIGVPVDSKKFTISAYLNIFDSKGNLVQSFKKTDSFVQTAGVS